MPRRAQALLLFAALVVLLLREISDPDIWFYLVLGREIAATHAIPAQEFYLFPALGEPALFPAWGFGLLHYAAYQLAGYAGMATLNALLGAGALTLLVAGVGRARADDDSPWHWPVVLGALALVFACLNFRLVYRPESTLYLFLAIEILLLERWLADGRIARLGWLPLLSWGITQLHTTAIVLLLVYGAYFCHWAVHVVRQRLPAAGQAIRLAAIGVAMLLLPLINPNGVDQLLVLVKDFGNGWNGLVEYLPVWQTPALQPFVALAAIAAWACWRAPERRLVDVLLLAGFGYLAASHVRNLGLFALVALLPVARTLLHHLARDTMALSVDRRRALAGGLAVLSISGLIAMTWRIGGWGVGVQAGTFPVKAAELVRRVAPQGNVMNLYHLGGYLAWELGPGYRAAIDGHFVRPSAAQPYHDRIIRADPDWQALLDRHQVDVIVTQAITPYAGRMIPLVERLADAPHWRLLSVEPAGMLFARDGHGAELPGLDKQEIWRQVQREVETVLVQWPERQEARDSLALAARRLAEPSLSGMAPPAVR